jgi:protease IV
METNETIFKTSIRSLFKSLFAVVGFFIALIPIFLIFMSMGAKQDITAKTKMNILPDLNGSTKMVSLKAPVILEIGVKGVIGDKTLTADNFRALLLESQKGILKNRIKGILIQMNSPGGSGNDSDDIYHMIKEYKAKYKIPVYTYVSGLCASGGMYIAASTDKILSSPNGIIGSVGSYFGPFLNYYDGMQKIGINSKIFKNGKNKAELIPFLKWKENEGSDLIEMNKHFYQRFVDVVAKNRPNLSKTKLINEYGASIFDAQRAKKYGYVDTDDTYYEDALLAILEASKVDPTKDYQVVELQPKPKFLEQIMQGKSFIKAKIEHSLNMKNESIDKNQLGIQYLYSPQN